MTLQSVFKKVEKGLQGKAPKGSSSKSKSSGQKRREMRRKKRPKK